MTTQSRIDDATAEALLSGRSVSAELAPLAEVMMAYRRIADQPVQPTAELAHQMSVGLFTRPVECVPQPTVDGSRWRRRRRTPARTALVSLLAGAGALIGGVASAGFAGVLPDPAQDRFETVVESVTPLEFRRGADPGQTRPEPGEFGGETSDDARDGGVDGGEVSERAREQGGGHPPTELPSPAAPQQPGPPSDVPAPVDPGIPEDPGAPEESEPPDDSGRPRDPGPPDGNPPAPPGAGRRPTAPPGG